MGMKKFVLIGFLFCVMLIIPGDVKADTACYQDGCANTRLVGGRGYMLYSSNVENLFNNTNYAQCNIGGSKFSLLAADFDRDSISDIVQPKAQSVYVYDRNCGIIDYIDLAGETLQAMPIIFNHDFDVNPNLILLTTKALESWEYDTAQQNFVKQFEFNLDDNLGVSDFDLFTCPRDFNLTSCILFRQRNVFVINMSSSTQEYYNKTNELTYTTHANTIRNGITAVNMNDGSIKIVMCSEAQTDNFIDCFFLDKYGNETGVRMNVVGGSFTVDSFEYHLGTIAKSENQEYLFIHSKYKKSGTWQHVTKVFDLDGNLVHTAMLSGAPSLHNVTSNWVIADENKDGASDACYLINDSTSYPDTPLNQIYLRCYDPFFSYVTAEHMLIGEGTNNSILNMTNSVVMGDFYPDSDLLTIATIEGMFAKIPDPQNPSVTGYWKVFNTTVPYSTARNGTSIIFDLTGSGNPVYAYSDNTIGFIVRNIDLAPLCGNGVCDSFENSWSCPEDCGANASGLINRSGDICEKDSDCEYGVCEYGFCTLAGAKAECDSDLDCLSGVCSNGKCTMPSYWNRIQASKNQQYGDDSDTNNFIALFFMILIPAGIIWIGRSVVAILAALGVFFVLTIFFLIVGWLSPFIFVGVLLVALITIVIAFMLNGSSD